MRKGDGVADGDSEERTEQIKGRDHADGAAGAIDDNQVVPIGARELTGGIFDRRRNRDTHRGLAHLAMRDAFRLEKVAKRQHPEWPSSFVDDRKCAKPKGAEQVENFASSRFGTDRQNLAIHDLGDDARHGDLGPRKPWANVPRSIPN